MATPRSVSSQANAVKARAELQRRAAVRAVDDPVKLARAARIIRAALERNKLTLADLKQQEGGTDAA